MRIDPVLSVNVVQAAIGAALGGTGITCALSYQVAQHLERGALIRLLPAFEPPPMPVHIVYPSTGARTARVRAFVELAAPRLRSALS